MKAVSLLQERLGGLLGTTVSEVRRLAVGSAEGVIPSLSTLVLRIGDRYAVMSYSQEAGLVCKVAAAESELTWSGELDEGESVVLVELEDAAVLPELPLRVQQITGWTGFGSYDDILAVALAGDGHSLVVTTTRDDLLCTCLDTARQEAELVANNHHMRLDCEILTSEEFHSGEVDADGRQA
jgi:hypothetical protein